MDRRDSIKLMLVGGAAAATLPGCAPADIERAAEAASQRQPDGSFSDYEWLVFSGQEREMLAVLTDDIIPADDRSPGAREARVPEFIDFIAFDLPEFQTPLQGGLAWLDREARTLFHEPYASCSAAQRNSLLDRIAWPESAAEEDQAGVKFFTLARNLTASGYWSSKTGMEDVGFMGNSPDPGWNGCTAEALSHAGRVG